MKPGHAGIDVGHRDALRLVRSCDHHDRQAERTRRLYEFRQRRFKIRAGKIEDEDGLEEGSQAYQRMMHEIYAAQRAALCS